MLEGIFTDDAMDGNQFRSAFHSRRKPVILIGAPSGAGKTVLSHRIIDGKLPLLNQLCGGLLDASPICHDWKSLPQDLPRDQILIIACSTHKFEDVTDTDQWRRLLDVLRDCEKVVLVGLDVPRHTLFRQYFGRIFSHPKRMHPLQRVVQLTKYRNAFGYLLTSRLERSNAAWWQFGRDLVADAEMSTRVDIVHVRRCGTDYSVTLERVAVPMPS